MSNLNFDPYRRTIRTVRPTRSISMSEPGSTGIHAWGTNPCAEISIENGSMSKETLCVLGYAPIVEICFTFKDNSINVG
tara:strand:+ start:655 stop:891 length:237 start_codon:yes stop_codon:yes gene_type:complete